MVKEDTFLSSDKKRSFLRPSSVGLDMTYLHLPFSFPNVLYPALSFPHDRPVANAMGLVGTQGQSHMGW